jgi:hypothetical protein
MTARQTRAQRLAMPLARDVVRELAVSNGACIRPVQLRRTDLHTGRTEPVLTPCGHTLASVCPSCAERKWALRAAQCRDGWHLDHEPAITPDAPDEVQLMWRTRTRADTQQARDHAHAAGQDTTELTGVLTSIALVLNMARTGLGIVHDLRDLRRKSLPDPEDEKTLNSDDATSG